MGLGIAVWLPIEDRGKSYFEEYFRDLKHVIPHMIAPIFDEGGFCVRAVSFEQDIMGVWQDDMLMIEAKTNSAGPGYHAYVCELIDGLGVAPVKIDDETGYFENRDYAALQRAMEDWLRAVGMQILQISKSGEYSNIAVSMTLDWSPVSGHFTCCPLGNFDIDFFKGIQTRDDFGHEFFIWWNKERDARFYRNVAVNMMLCDINWLPPQDDFEAHAIKLVLDCLDTASGLDPALDYPAAEWIELANLAGNTTLAKMLTNLYPDAGEARLGYKRGLIASNANGWRFTHDGKMHFAVENDITVVYWNDRLTIRATSFAVEFEDAVANKTETLLNDFTQDAGYAPFTQLRNPDIMAKIMQQTIEEDGQVMQETVLCAALENTAILLTIYYDNEDDRGMALAICQSLAR